ALNVAYRDFRYVIPFLVQLWMFATPSIYMQVADEPVTVAQRPTSPSVDVQPRRNGSPAPAKETSSSVLRAALALNPMTGLIAAFRAAALGGSIPWRKLAASSVFALVAFLVGCFYFRRVEDGFADII